MGDRPETQRRLLSLGVETIGHLAALDDAALRELFGSWVRNCAISRAASTSAPSNRNAKPNRYPAKRPLSTT